MTDISAASFGSTDAVDLGRLYADARSRIAALVAHADPTLPVPATPAWTVHDVVAHVRGVVQDGMAGNMAGAPGEAWTAAQVERAREVPVADLIAAWGEQAPGFEAFLSSPAGANATAAVIDVLTHECDLRGALGADGRPDDTALRFAFDALAGSVLRRAGEAGLPPLRIITHEGDVTGPDDAAIELRVSRYELVRAVLGRRCPAQVLAYDWSGDPAPYLAHVATFGPREDPLVD